MTCVLDRSGDLRVVLRRDEDVPSPRKEFDNTVHVITVHNRDYEVDEDYGPLYLQWLHLWGQAKSREHAVELFCRYVRIFHGGYALIDYEPWSIWYVTGDQVSLAYAPEGREKYAEGLIRAEQAEYRYWRDDEVYGYAVERREVWRKDGSDEVREEWTTVEDCWGFYGWAHAEEEARRVFGEVRAKEAK